MKNFKFLIIIITNLFIGCNNKVIRSNEINISEDEAKDIVLSKVPNGKIVECLLDNYDYILNYDISVLDGNYEYDFEINATNGDITEKEKKRKLIRL